MKLLAGAQFTIASCSEWWCPELAAFLCTLRTQVLASSESQTGAHVGVCRGWSSMWSQNTDPSPLWRELSVFAYAWTSATVPSCFLAGELSLAFGVLGCTFEPFILPYLPIPSQGCSVFTICNFHPPSALGFVWADVSALAGSLSSVWWTHPPPYPQHQQVSCRSEALHIEMVVALGPVSVCDGPRVSV